MPLLRKKPFVRNPIPEYLSDEDRVYYCDITDEIFQHYADLSDRIILCNSLVWSCQFTGKQCMTYQEAKASEDHARALLKEFPLELRIPVLYLASLTRRTSFENMAEDVFAFTRERYFVGESVEVNITEETWCESHVLQIVPPTKGEIDSFQDASCGRYEATPAALFRYEIETYDANNEVKEEVVKASHVHRKKGLYTRDKNRLYLKQFAEEGHNGVWVIKKDVLQKFAIPRVKFETIFIGKPPEFQASKNTRKALANAKPKVNTQTKKQNSQNMNNKKEKKQESIQRYLTTSNDQNKKKMPAKSQTMSPGKQAGQSKKTTQKQMAEKVKEKYRNVGGVTKKYSKSNLVMSAEKLQLLKEQQKEKAVEEKKKKLEERMKERAKMKEDKLRLAEFMKEWNRQREDLECEDLKPLPIPTPVQCRVPNEHFGDFLMILEFFHNFSDALSTKDYFPYGVTFDLVERALTAKEVAGPLSDMLQFLLQTLFTMQEEENDEIVDYKTSADLEIDERVDVTTAEAIKSATAAASWSQLYQGTPISKLSLDSVTVTEVLRLHLLSSGGRCSEMNCKWRYQERGGYTSHDDPGLMLRIHSPHILRALSMVSVFELPLGDQLTIITCLMDQILTYAALRDVIDERCEKVKALKIELKAHQLAVLKRERELASLRIKQRRDAKQKPKTEPAQADSPDSVHVTEEDLARLEKEIIRRQSELQRKASELHTASMGHRAVPLGSDRAYRRFWVFNSLPGLFVENFTQHVGTCLSKPTPHNPGLSSANDTVLYVRRLFEEEKGNGGSDKENDSYEETKRSAASPKKLLAEKNTVHNTEAIKADGNDDEKAQFEILVCTASENCPVHSGTTLTGRTQWSFFSSEEEVQSLIENLNSRGIREGDLKQCLVEESPKLVQAMAKCPVHKLDPSRPCNNAPEERKGSRSTYTVRYEDSNLHYPADTPADDVMELALRDLILELEEKVYCGGLGSLKVHDREIWRNLIACRSYDSQCDQLNWGGKEQDESLENIPNLKFNGINGRRSRPATPASRAGTPSNASRSATPSNISMEGNDSSTTSKHEPTDLSIQELTQNAVVRDLASAILQISQCVEKKYRQKPLVPEESCGKSLSQIERWEMSLMASTSFSQLCVHYYTFESSIQWSKSALNAYCRLCRRRGDPVNMLLCDSCNKGHHMYCLKPKLTKVPQGDWFCPKCRPHEKTPRTPRKRRAIFEEEEEDDETEEESFMDTEIFTEVCDTCGEGGRVICCDTETCPLVFHIECLNPPLKKVPRGKWFCPKCKTPTSAELQHAFKDVDDEWRPEATERSPPSNRNRRCCTAATVAKISEFAKRLRSKSWDNDSTNGSVQSDDQSNEMQPSRRSARHSLEPDLDLPLNNALLQDLLTEVMHHKDAWPFLRPVPRSQVPDYHLIIKRPMDLGTIKNKLNMCNYVNNSEFIADALLIFENCQMYNQLDAQEYKSGVRLRRFFEKRCKELGLQLMIKDELDKVEPDRKKVRIDEK